MTSKRFLFIACAALLKFSAFIQCFDPIKQISSEYSIQNNLFESNQTNWRQLQSTSSVYEYWILQNSGISNSFTPQEINVAVIDKQDNIYIMSSSKIWKSTDRGGFWTELTMSTPNWGTRSYHTAVIDSQGTIYVIGGYINSAASSDVWTSANGITWTKITQTTTFSARFAHASVIDSSDNIYVIAGRFYWNETAISDVSKSSNKGVSWTRVGSVPRAVYSPTAVMNSNGAIFVIGGGANELSYDDVFKSTNGGVTWTTVTSSPGFSARYMLSSVYDPFINRIYIIAGYSNTQLDDMWCSDNDGKSWHRTIAIKNFSPARYSAAAVRDSSGNIVLMGGGGGNGDVWYTGNATVPDPPTGQPSRRPSGQPTRQPSRKPSGQPSRNPSRQPSGQPSRQPSGQPSREPSGQPSSQPSRRPTGTCTRR